MKREEQAFATRQRSPTLSRVSSRSMCALCSRRCPLHAESSLHSANRFRVFGANKTRAHNGLRILVRALRQQRLCHCQVPSTCHIMKRILSSLRHAAERGEERCTTPVECTISTTAAPPSHHELHWKENVCRNDAGKGHGAVAPFQMAATPATPPKWLPCDAMTRGAEQSYLTRHPQRFTHAK
jgi:hypothetical protein